MADTLRKLLIQRAARLQERPALTAPGWGTLAWGAWRNRVEGLGLGLLSVYRPVGGAVCSTTGTPWDWAAEVAAACCGLRWEAGGESIPPAVFGGAAFNHEAGRGPYHEREDLVLPDTPFLPGLDHGALLQRLGRLNRRLGWDHRTEFRLSLARLTEAAPRAALWSLLYAGGHAILEAPRPRSGWRGVFRSPNPEGDLGPFESFWSE